MPGSALSPVKVYGWLDSSSSKKKTQRLLKSDERNIGNCFLNDERHYSTKIIRSSTCHDFQASHRAELSRTIWNIRERSVCCAANDARGLLLAVPGWAEDDQDMEPVIKRDTPRSRTSLSPHNPRFLFFTASFTSQHSSCPPSWVSPPLLFQRLFWISIHPSILCQM